MSWLWKWMAPEENIPTRPKTYQSIVLDMDECLLHSWDITKKDYFKQIENSPKTVGLRRHFFEVYAEKSNNSTPVYGIMRPGLLEFLLFCFDRFDHVILWSAGEDYYVERLSDYIFYRIDKLPTKVLSRSNCHVVRNMFTKPLSHLANIDPSITLENCFFVDDNPDNSLFNKNNHILIPPFDPECTIKSISYALHHDKALFKLIEWLQRPEVKASKDVRTLNMDNIFIE